MKSLPRNSGFWLSVCLIAGIHAYFRAKNVDLRVALEGWSPLHYLWLKEDPVAASLDWPSGLREYDFSLAIQLFRLAAENLPADPESLLRPFALLQVAAALLAGAFLAHTLFRDPITTLLATAVLALAPVAGINFANFGNGYGNYSPYLYYNFANALRVISIALFLRGRLRAAAIVLALALYSHVTMALFAAAFIGGYYMLQPRLLFDRRFASAASLFVVLVIPFVIMISSRATLTAGSIDETTWIMMSRIFNYHWHPVQMGYFTTSPQIKLYPSVMALAAFFLALRHSAVNREMTVLVVGGMAVSVVLTIVGILVGEVWYLPFLMKIALHRASELVTLFSLLYFAHYITKAIDSRSFLRISVAIIAIVLLLTSDPGVSLAVLVLFASLDLYEGRIGPWTAANRRPWRITAIVLTTGAAAWAISASVVHPLSPWLASLDPSAAFDLFAKGGRPLVGDSLPRYVWLLALPAAFGLLWMPRRRMILVSIMIIATVTAVDFVLFDAWSRTSADRANDLRQAQLWARSATPSQAVFMGDPAYYVAWREYSHRPYFGTVSEQAFSATLYNSRPDVLDEGIRRVREFGVDLLAITEEDIRHKTDPVLAQSLQRRIHQRYYSMRAEELVPIAKRYGVSYIVMEKQFLRGHAPALPIAYQNRGVLVLTVQ